MKLADLPTPALLLDYDLFTANLARMAEHARAAGKQLRPHAKAHKCAEIAKRQIAAGAAGVCVATVPEAEYMVRSGITGVLLTSPVADAHKAARLAELGRVDSSLILVVDHAFHVQMLNDTAAAAGVVLNVLVDLDLGDHRTGVAPGQPALELARTVTEAPALRFAGLQAYSVRASHTQGVEARADFSRGRLAEAIATRDLLRAHGIAVPVLTGGSTGTVRVDATVDGVTELQAGSYALMDVAYARIGGVDFAHALTVLATVVSANHTDRVTVDAGLKAFSTDRPFGPEVIDPAGARYEWGGDEFGYVHVTERMPPIRLGERLRFIPPHCDPTVNLYDRIHVHRGEQVEDVWTIMDRLPPGRSVPKISRLKPTAVNTVLAEVRSAEPHKQKLVSLMRGEPDFPTPVHIVEAGMRALREGRTSYPDNRGEIVLRAAVAEKLQRENAIAYDPASEVLITDGATLGIYAALTALVNQGDEVLLPDPVYDAYQSPIHLTGASVRAVRSEFRGGRFSLTREALDSAWTPSARVLLLNTPWNPVGTVLTRDELRDIAAFVQERDLTLISDEIYEWITYDPHRHISPASLADEVRRRCVLVNSFSKTYAMTGWRLGYCAAPKEIIQSMLLVLQQSSRGPATFVQHAGAAALRGPQDCVGEMRRAYAQRRRLVLDSLADVPRVRALPPEGGFFAMVDVRELGRSSNDIRRRLLEDAGVVVMHGSAYGPAAEGTLRVSFASGGENLAAGLERLREGLRSL
jgi:aspartate/methionine/tyrosine aminotransferase/D-serine deaminase-like pyridoxal phosphate-dependent protein